MRRPLVIFALLLLIASCKKNSFITTPDAAIEVSADSIHFDTLFTTTGSVTHYFKIFNLNDQKLKLSAVTLSGGMNSLFSINADGAAGPSISDLELDANDSIYVFVTVQVDPGSANTPFVVQDSISISYNGNTRWVQLDAWGQNANFLRERVVTGDTTWTNEKPFVILGGLLVAEGAVLNIEEGTKIFLHADAPMIVDGSLKATGNKYDSTLIVFAGDRLDELYRDLPASWPGIYFRKSSAGSVLKHVVVKNAYQGVVADQPSPAAQPKVTLQECVIDNCYDAGIIAVNSSINASNCVISNCGKNIQLVQGGVYQFTHCTDVAISNSFIPHRQPVLAVTDFIKVGDNILTGDMEAIFTNCIFWGANGTVDNEVVAAKQANGTFDVIFKNCLWKNEEPPANVAASEMVENADPLFQSVDTRANLYNFRLNEGSPAINKGAPTVFSTDIDGNNRVNIPDIGAYETTF